MLNHQLVVASVTSYVRNNFEDEDLGKSFWQQWQQYGDYLYCCCLKWIGGNLTDTEDALSQAMLKGWQKVQKYAYTGDIANFKAWRTRLTPNLCVDIHREGDRGANRVTAEFKYLNHICCRGTAMLCPYPVVYLRENSCKNIKLGKNAFNSENSEIDFANRLLN
ncbi:RNA polymerase sigma factor [Nostoc sp.]|uniref:RNA polymerase sigma factor n=1 Tax=Nostoc sp. TaxID=1180 RepID=UPI002FF5B5F7